MKKKKWIIPVIFLVIFILGGFIFLQIYRHSTPEITELKLSTSVTEDNRPNNPSDIFASTDNIYLSGRLAHVDKITVEVELFKDKNQENYYDYPKTFEISVLSYPNNYFSFKLEAPIQVWFDIVEEESPTIPTSKFWEIGEYELKVYPEGDKSPIKPTIKFKVVEKESEKISQEEKEKIEKWILQNDLNEYGDPKDTIYAGGTPLFNEATGEKIYRFQYILSQHPERPWNK